MSMEQKIEQFVKQLIKYHGFGASESFSCLIPDKESPSNEGLFIWFFSKKRGRFETKIEKFHLKTRFKKMKDMLGLSEEEYTNILPAVVTYLDELKKIGFSNIGKGVNLFEQGKFHNLQAGAELFENNLDALKKLEELTINNPVISFLEKQGYFKVQNKDSLVWDEFFGTAKKVTKSKAKTSVKSKSKTSEKTAVKKSLNKAISQPKNSEAKSSTSNSEAKSSTSNSEAKSETTSIKVEINADLSEQFKKLASHKIDSTLAFWQRRQITWNKQANELYKKIQTWISGYTKSGYIKTSIHQVQVFDSLNKSYFEIDALHLDIVGGHKIVFNPVEMNILGAIARMDVQHYGNNGEDKIIMLLVDKGKSRFTWELWSSLKNKQSVNKGTFENLLSQWIGE
ncbi:MAG: hypothetical protein KAH84_02245 [Thiomargarita sp.]|nr:hypothetical protein [Thiomargarita sp.]